jgi:hypothetical protein
MARSDLQLTRPHQNNTIKDIIFDLHFFFVFDTLSKTDKPNSIPYVRPAEAQVEFDTLYWESLDFVRSRVFRNSDGYPTRIPSYTPGYTHLTCTNLDHTTLLGILVHRDKRRYQQYFHMLHHYSRE